MGVSVPLPGFAWVTLATNDSYSLGALVLAHSLRQVGTTHQLAVLVTPGVTAPMRQKLATVFNVVQEVDILNSKDEANLRLLQRPELGITFTKLHCWRLTQFEKCVFLDADTLVLGNSDELFEREEFSAAPDVGWPDCFNSGVFVYRPSNETYENLIKFALEKGSFDGGDQGLLNLYFSDWAHKDITKHLPFIYNMCSTACYSYLPAFKQFGDNVKIVHFIGPAKPWLQYFDTETRQVHPSPGLHHLQSVLQRWWNIFCSLIHPNLTSDMARTSRSSAVHYTPSHSYEYHNPSYNNPSFHESEYFNEIASSSNDYRNVFDPWDSYDDNNDNTQSSKSIIIEERKVELESPSPIIHHFTVDTSKKNDDFVKPFESHDKNAQNVVFHKSESQNQQTESISFHNPSPIIEPIQQQHSISNTSNVFESSSTHNSNKEIDVVIHYPKPDPVQIPIETNNHPVIQNPAPPDKFEPPSIIASESTLLYNDDEDAKNDAGLAGALAQVTLGAPRTSGQSALEDHLRRQGWEVGNIDYLGIDSFENIWKKICETLASAPPPPAPTPKKTKEPTPPREVLETPIVPAKTETQTQQETLTEAPKVLAETPKPEPASIPKPELTEEVKVVPEKTAAVPTESTPPAPEVSKPVIESVPAATAPAPDSQAAITPITPPIQSSETTPTSPPQAVAAPESLPAVVPEGTPISQTVASSAPETSPTVASQIPVSPIPIPVSEPPAAVCEKPVDPTPAPICEKTETPTEAPVCEKPTPPVCEKPVAPTETVTCEKPLTPEVSTPAPVCEKPAVPTEILVCEKPAVPEAPTPAPVCEKTSTPVCEKPSSPEAPIPTTVCEKPASPEAPIPTTVCEKPASPEAPIPTTVCEKPAAPVPETAVIPQTPICEKPTVPESLTTVCEKIPVVPETITESAKQVVEPIIQPTEPVKLTETAKPTTEQTKPTVETVAVTAEPIKTPADLTSSLTQATCESVKPEQPKTEPSQTTKTAEEPAKPTIESAVPALSEIALAKPTAELVQPAAVPAAESVKPAVQTTKPESPKAATESPKPVSAETVQQSPQPTEKTEPTTEKTAAVTTKEAETKKPSEQKKQEGAKPKSGKESKKSAQRTESPKTAEATPPTTPTTAGPQQKTEQPASSDAAAGPTPPPRKGSGNVKKSKAKK